MARKPNNPIIRPEKTGGRNPLPKNLKDLLKDPLQMGKAKKTGGKKKSRKA